MSVETTSFANRCKSLPVVNSTYSLINDYYNRVKETNRLTKYTIGLAETTVKTSIGLANPVLDKFKGPIQALDTIACRQLDKLETAYPIIHEDTNTVVNKSKELIRNKINEINAIEDKYGALKKYGLSKISLIINSKEEIKELIIKFICNIFTLMLLVYHSLPFPIFRAKIKEIIIKINKTIEKVK